MYNNGVYVNIKLAKSPKALIFHASWKPFVNVFLSITW